MSESLPGPWPSRVLIFASVFGAVGVALAAIGTHAFADIEAARDRKTRGGRYSRAPKWLFGRFDGWFGSKRGDNAAYLN